MHGAKSIHLCAPHASFFAKATADMTVGMRRLWSSGESFADLEIDESLKSGLINVLSMR